MLAVGQRNNDFAAFYNLIHVQRLTARENVHQVRKTLGGSSVRKSVMAA